MSTDKAANPVNMMGASKRIMYHHHALAKAADLDCAVRQRRVFGRQLAAWVQPTFCEETADFCLNDVRYFVTPQESESFI